MQAEAEKAAEEERLRRLIEPAQVELQTPSEDRYLLVGRDVAGTRRTVADVAASFAEAVALMVGEPRYDADVLVVPGRQAPIAYPREASYIAMAAGRRRGVSLGSDTFYREVSDRVWTAVFMGSARGANGRVVGFCYGVFLSSPDGEHVVVGVDEVPIAGMVPGTRRVPTRMSCMPGESTVADPERLE